MRAWGRKKSRGLLCFGAAAAEEEAWAGSSGRSDESSTNGRRPGRRFLHTRALARIFRSVAFVMSLNPGGNERKDSNRLLGWKGSGSTVRKRAAESSLKSTDGDDDDRQTVAVLSSASSSSSTSSSFSCSSSSSRRSSATSSGFPDPPEPKERRKRTPRRAAESRKRPPPAPALATSRSCGPATVAFLLLVSLMMMVFCGRLPAILWTSSWLCFIVRRNRESGRTAATAEVMEAKKLWRREAETESEEKRRVVLEGLLQRDRKV